VKTARHTTSDSGTSPRNCSAGVAFSLVHVFPVGIERAGYPVISNPRPQYLDRRPDRLFLPHTNLHFASGIIYHVHPATPRPTLLQPIVKAPVQLHQFAKVRFALSSWAVFLSPPLPAPPSFRQHPTAQGFVINGNPVFFRQVLGRQPRPESLLFGAGIFFPDSILNGYCSFAYSALACFRMGMSGSASFHRLRKS
jgi:hypothetical protein